MNIENYETFERLENSSEELNFQDSQINSISKELDFVNNTPEAIVEVCDNAVKSFYPSLGYRINFTSFRGKTSTIDEALNSLESKYFEAPTDNEQIERIADYLSSREDIKFENWSKYSIEKMVEILNEIDKDVAKITHRNPQTVSAKNFDDPNTFGEHIGNDIKINARLLEKSATNSDIFYKTLETFIHEGRHAYQSYNVLERRVHQSQAEVKSWAENWKSYSSNNQLGYYSGDPVTIPFIGPLSFSTPKLTAIGERLYYYQPTEIDAREFASDVMTKYGDNLANPWTTRDELEWMKIMANASSSPFESDFWGKCIQQSPSFKDLSLDKN